MSILIVSSSEAAAARMEAWLGEARCTVVQTEAQARPLLADARFDMVIVNAPLADGDGGTLCTRTGVDAILLVPQAQYDKTFSKLQRYGVLVLAKPISPGLFQQAVGLARASRREVTRLKRQLAEVRVVERAKWALMQMLGMTEPQAHRYLEKQAMDRQLPVRAVAENIIKTYENG